MGTQTDIPDLFAKASATARSLREHADRLPGSIDAAYAAGRCEAEATRILRDYAEALADRWAGIERGTPPDVRACDMLGTHPSLLDALCADDETFAELSMLCGLGHVPSDRGGFIHGILAGGLPDEKRGR